MQDLTAEIERALALAAAGKEFEAARILWNKGLLLRHDAETHRVETCPEQYRYFIHYCLQDENRTDHLIHLGPEESLQAFVGELKTAHAELMRALRVISDTSEAILRSLEQLSYPSHPRLSQDESLGRSRAAVSGLTDKFAA